MRTFVGLSRGGDYALGRRENSMLMVAGIGETGVEVVGAWGW
jgi:hypothetical protein